MVFGLVGVVYPWPLFSLHGGPAWILLALSFPCMLVFYIVRVCRCPKEKVLKYVGINLFSASVYLVLAISAGYVVSKTVMNL